ncbi:MAG: hypothetical protein ACLQVI_29070 [Polyangiaceae bacterium]
MPAACVGEVVRACALTALRGRLLGLCLSLAPFACSRPTPSPLLPADAAPQVAISVRVPGALSVARAIDTLSVAIDPASLGVTQVAAHAGTTLGVEADVLVFRAGEAEGRPLLERHDLRSGPDFALGTTTWSTAHDGVPAPGTKYIVEMQLVLFETSASRGAGAFNPLWTRTLRQAEE